MSQIPVPSSDLGEVSRKYFSRPYSPRGGVRPALPSGHWRASFRVLGSPHQPAPQSRGVWVHQARGGRDEREDGEPRDGLRHPRYTEPLRHVGQSLSDRELAAPLQAGCGDCQEWPHVGRWHWPVATGRRKGVLALGCTRAAWALVEAGTSV